MSKKFIDEQLEELNKKQFYDLVKYLRKAYDMDTEILEWMKEKKVNYDSNQNEMENSSRYNELVLNLLMRYWGEARKIISDFNEYGGGYEADEDKAYDLLDNISAILQEEELPQNLKIKLIDEIFQEYNMHNSCFEDALIHLSFEICSTREDWIYLIKKLEERLTNWNKKIIMDIYKNHLDNETGYLDTLKSSLKWGSDYWELASYYIGKRNLKEAIKVCEEGIEKGEGRNREIFDFLIKYYLKNKNIEDFKRVVYKAVDRRCDEEEMLLKLFDYYKANNLYEESREILMESYKYSSNKYKKYNQIKNNLLPEDWNKYEADILQEMKDQDIEAYLRICIDKDKKDEVIEYIKGSVKNKLGYPIMINLNEFADKLKKDYPKEVIEYYYRKAFSNIENGDRKTYKVAVKYLEKAKNIYINILKDENRWNMKLLEIKSRYSRKKAFLEEAREL